MARCRKCLTRHLRPSSVWTTRLVGIQTYLLVRPVKYFWIFVLRVIIRPTMTKISSLVWNISALFVESILKRKKKGKKFFDVILRLTTNLLFKTASDFIQATFRCNLNVFIDFAPSSIFDENLYYLSDCTVRWKKKRSLREFRFRFQCPRITFPWNDIYTNVGVSLETL